jgi:hypothetical protein
MRCVRVAAIFVARRGSPLGLRGVHGNKTGSNTINTSDATAKPRAIIINDLVQHGCVPFVVFHEHRHDFIFFRGVAEELLANPVQATGI